MNTENVCSTSMQGLRTSVKKARRTILKLTILILKLKVFKLNLKDYIVPVSRRRMVVQVTVAL